MLTNATKSAAALMLIPCAALMVFSATSPLGVVIAADDKVVAATPAPPVPLAPKEHLGDVTRAPKRPWDSQRDLPPPVASDKSVTFDYPIVYVRVPRPYPARYDGINHLNQAGLHQTNAPGAELRLLHPDGRDESLVAVSEKESITDPAVSFDGQWVYFAKFHHMDTGATANMTKLQSKQGSDIYKIHVPTRKVVQLTTQQRTPNTGAACTTWARAPSPAAGSRSSATATASAACARKRSRRRSSSSWMTTAATWSSSAR